MNANLIAKIFDPIAKDLRSKFDGIYVTGEYVDAPPQFPAVSIVEADNYLDYEKMSTKADEEYSIVMYEVEVYTNLEKGKQMQAREILSEIDAILYDLNFTRLSMTPVPNLANTSIYRLVARYRAETDGTTLYRR